MFIDGGPKMKKKPHMGIIDCIVKMKTWFFFGLNLVAKSNFGSQ